MPCLEWASSRRPAGISDPAARHMFRLLCLYNVGDDGKLELACSALTCRRLARVRIENALADQLRLVGQSLGILPTGA